jgi:hypothetical protein
METGGLFCRVCREALVLAIHEYVDPIEKCTPDVGPPLAAKAALDFEVIVTRPKNHAVEVRWWVLPEAGAPKPARPERDGKAGRRGGRGPLAPIKDEPAHTSTNNFRGVHAFRLTPSGMKPGRYRVICRAKDTTKIGDDLWAWVLKDERGLLESERTWSVVVAE